jgi:hypothetical protein
MARDLGSAPLHVEKAVARHRTWRAVDELLASKIETAEQLPPIVERLLEELKRSHPGAFKTALHRKLDQLEDKANAEQEEVVLLQEQIEKLRALSKKSSSRRKPPKARRRRKAGPRHTRQNQDV